MKTLIEKWKKMPNSVKSTIVFTISSFIIKGIAFLVTPLFTRIMSIDDYGIIITYNSWISIMDVFALLSLTSAGVFNIGLNDHKNNRDEFISSCLGLCNLTTLMVFAVVFTIKLFIYKDFLLDLNLLIIMFVHYIFIPAQVFWLTRQKYEYRYKMAALVTIMSVLFSQIISVFCVISLKNNPAFYKTLGYEFGLLLFSVPIYAILLKRGKKYIDFKEWKNLLKLSIPLIPHYLAQHVLSTSDRIMISKFVDTASTAIYGVVSYISLIASIIWSSINASLVPYTFEKLNKKKYKDINNICMKLIIGCAIICCLVMLMAPEVLIILAPKNYKNGIFAVPPLVFVVFLQALYNLFANIEFYHKKTGRIATATVIASTFNVLSNLIIIPKYSYIGAAYTTMFSTIVSIVLHYKGYKKCQQESVYDIKSILLISLVVFVFSMISNLLYLNNPIRYFIIFVIVIAIFIYRKKIINIFKIIKK